MLRCLLAQNKQSRGHLPVHGPLGFSCRSDNSAAITESPEKGPNPLIQRSMAPGVAKNPGYVHRYRAGDLAMLRKIKIARSCMSVSFE